jgi:hypothetical protein
MINILICCVKKDYHLAKICVASIRYFYPDVAIYLLKDEGEGNFSTKELETCFGVRLIDYGIKKFGWAAGKIFFCTDKRFAGERFLILDTDIVMIGKLLDVPWTATDWDVIVDAEKLSNPYEEWFSSIYFETSTIERMYPDFYFPGYVFNTGQLFYKVGCVERETYADFFDFKQYPFWKKLDIFPLVDQSLFNYLLPTLHHQQKLTLVPQHFMYWSEGNEVKQQLKLEDIKNETAPPFVIHWAGAFRSPLVNKMSRSDILLFFEQYYFSRVPFGKLKLKLHKCYHWPLYWIKAQVSALRRLIKRN